MKVITLRSIAQTLGVNHSGLQFAEEIEIPNHVLKMAAIGNTFDRAILEQWLVDDLNTLLVEDIRFDLEHPTGETIVFDWSNPESEAEFDRRITEETTDFEYYSSMDQFLLAADELALYKERSYQEWLDEWKDYQPDPFRCEDPVWYSC